MGAKITIDSASLMNKGFEVTEAKWLFGVPADKIEVLIHPQSVVHSAVQFVDGAVKDSWVCQICVCLSSMPSLSFSVLGISNGDRLDLFKTQDLQFFKPDYQKFKCLQLAFDAIRKGGNMPCIVNAANEIVNAGFRKVNVASFRWLISSKRRWRRLLSTVIPTSMYVYLADRC